MSRPTETSCSGRPSGAGSGEITTSQHFGVPLWVGQKPWNRPMPPALACARAASAVARSSPCQTRSQDKPMIASASEISIASMPPGLTKRV